MFTHNFDPILINFEFFAIRWYSLAYVFGILIGWWYGKKIILKTFSLKKIDYEYKEFDNLITYLIISIIIGGRLGYVTFYNFEFYVKNPIEIFKIWQGGMSFHGALIGIVICTYFFSLKKNLKSLIFLDVIACVSPIGIFFGRIANFINGELVGKISNVPWSVIFPNIDMMPRHPSQLYEALLEGAILFFLMNYLISRKNYKIGTCSFMFLISYGTLRIISEFFREPDIQIGYIFKFLSMGMILSIAMIITGFLMKNYLNKNEI